ncbi:MAG: hypothetical protein K0Q72_2023, partial [Armatimonadetes bacterium]|nr:hypothetical protein [Armatimonadota bacterium]
TGPAAFALHTVIGPDQSSYVDVGLASERTYVYRLVAYNAGGDSPYSTEVAGTTHPEAPGAPQGLTALALSATTIQLDWLDISSNEAGFRVERRTDTGSFTEIGATGTDVSSYTDESLQPNTTYRYRVRAHNVGGLSAYSNTANTATPAPPPVAPEGLQATVVSATEVALTWQDRSADETGFRVERSLGGASFLVLANLGPNVAAFRDVAAEPDSTYRYRVQSNRGSTRSDYSEVVTATTPVARGGQLVIGKKVDFKKIPVGTARTVSLVISNKDRNTALRVTIESPAAPFGLSSGTQTLVIPAKGKSTITLSFTPEARGAVFTTLVVHSSDPNRITNGVLLKGAGK